MHSKQISLAWSLALVIALVLTIVVSRSAQAQTFTVIHTFTGGGDGAQPVALVIDRVGNLYGTAGAGAVGYGTVFELTHKNSGWILTTLHSFAAGNDGAYPGSPVLIAADGTLYGTTGEGGGVGNCYYDGCGTVFHLMPPATACRTTLCPWPESVLYRFTGQNDGAFPDSGLIPDSAGNLYGTTLGGTVYELTRSQGAWTENTLYTFTGGSDGSGPGGGLIFDGAGNLYGTTDSAGAYNYGTVFDLTPSGSGWVETTLHAFTDGYSVAGLVRDEAGNLYGDTAYGGCCFSGTVFQLSPSNGSWTYAVLHNFIGELEGPTAPLLRDAEGNLYGTTYELGAYKSGYVFKLSRSNGSWTYIDLHDFTGGSDGGYPVGGLVLDAQGNLYGTASGGGENGCGGFGCGVVWEIKP
jgi:uncharacterized repeat protein (TIGR03803 family)